MSTPTTVVAHRESKPYPINLGAASVQYAYARERGPERRGREKIADERNRMIPGKRFQGPSNGPIGPSRFSFLGVCVVGVVLIFIGFI